MASNDENATNPLKWRVSNLLGFALMEVRDELRRVCANEDVANKGEYQLVLVR